MLWRRGWAWLRQVSEHGISSSLSTNSTYFQLNGVNMLTIMGEPILFPMLVLLAIVWLVPHTPLPSRLHTALNTTYHALPSVKVDYHPTATLASMYPRNKTALYLEPRPLAFLTPLLLHMLTVIPPSWSVLFIGSTQTADIARSSQTASRYEELGKLRILDIEEGEGSKWTAGWGRRWDDLSVDEMGNRLLTNLSFYEEELQGVEWLLVWHSDAILCANAEVDLEDWVGWDWVGAPWAGGGRFGGNGGLSIRNVDKVKEVLRFQKRLDNSNAEDQWLSARLGLLPDANMCPPDKEREFAVEDVWYEWPMGYHVNPGGLSKEVWDAHERRKQIYEYCPEIKIILDMRLERENCIQVPQIDIDFALMREEQAEKNESEDMPGNSMSRQEYSAQFAGSEGEEESLNQHIEELEEAISKLKEEGEDGKDGSESPKVDQNRRARDGGFHSS